MSSYNIFIYLKPPIPTPSFCPASTTPILTLSEIQQSYPLSRKAPRYRLNTWPLTDNQQSKCLEIRITGPTLRALHPEEWDTYSYPSDSDSQELNLSKQDPLQPPVSLDHLGRMWYPYCQDAIITTLVLDGPDKNNKRSYYMHELPKSRCSRWVILDHTALLSALESPEPGEPQQKLEMTEHTVLSPHSFVRNSTHWDTTATIFGKYQQYMHKIDFRFPENDPCSVIGDVSPSSITCQRLFPFVLRLPSSIMNQ